MLKYLIVLLDQSSVSFCHYENNRDERQLISKEDLKAGLLWAMKENLMVQFVYPDYQLPEEYLEIIESVDHIDISSNLHNGDIVICDSVPSISNLPEDREANLVLRLGKDELFEKVDEIIALIKQHRSFRIIVKDIADFDEADFSTYKSTLSKISDAVEEVIISGNSIQLSPVTDRIRLDGMNNCNAGVESITLAPDGKFYICPAFYYDELDDVGNPKYGLTIPNQQLYKLEYAPICRNCDAYQCKRCVWLNRKTTLEVNTPGHEQCVVAHLERNASMNLLNDLKCNGVINTHITIPEIDYLDPFEKISR